MTTIRIVLAIAAAVFATSLETAQAASSSSQYLQQYQNVGNGSPDWRDGGR